MSKRFILFPCLDRAILQISGMDAERYLNGQTTQDLRQVNSNQSLHSVICNAKGKAEGEAFIHRLDEQENSPPNFLLDVPSELTDALLLRLGKYLIADDAELENVTENWSLLHITEIEFSDLQAALAAHPNVNVRACKRLGQAGFDLLVPGSIAQKNECTAVTELDQVLNSLTQAGGTSLPPAEVEVLRISNGVPRWGAELTNQVLPPEAGLEASSISYTKGCYIGQEVISRIKSVGRVNRQLVRLSGDQWVPPQTELFAQADTDQTPKQSEQTKPKPAAVITSCIETPDGAAALAFLARKFADQSHLVSPNGANFTVLK